MGRVFHLLCVVVVCALLGVAHGLADSASAEAAGCAPTAAGTPPGPDASDPPCWTIFEPTSQTNYPFGFDGGPVNDTSPSCVAEQNTPAADCWLTVASMAFRAFNRGLAAMVPSNSAYSVWLFNGTRWFPDPTFPGPGSCPGSVVLWAGKLDYWLIGGTTLCRFDGYDYAWQPLSVPGATTRFGGGRITSGTCFAWNDCWFFGGDGARVHWDGQVLSDASVGQTPWLRTFGTAAALGGDGSGPFSLAAADPEPQQGYVNGATASDQPDGSPPPQLYASRGGAFSPLAFSPAVATAGGSIPRDLAAVSADASGTAWLATDAPGLLSAPGNGTPGNGLASTSNSPPAPVPLIAVDAAGQSPCADSSFQYTANTPGSTFWSSISALPDGEAWAGGEQVTAQRRANGSYNYLPLVARVGCGEAAASEQLTPPLPNTEADGIAALAANAVNDAWAATNGGVDPGRLADPPQLYRLTDGQAPDAAPGDDNESRPQVVQDEPTIFQFAPPVVIPPPPPPTKQYVKARPGKQRVKVKAAIFDVGRPTLKRAAGSGTFVLTVHFKVRRRVTIELEALRRKQVVARSGFHTFQGRSGALSLRITTRAYPTGLKFVLPRAERG